MATCSDKDHSDVSDKRLCSICSGRLVSPRYLHCYHSFCHGCLVSHIVASCESTDDPVGFSCPLCRKFISAPDLTKDPAEWADDLPLNRALLVLLDEETSSYDSKYCQACQRDNQEERGSDWCNSCLEYLCKSCAIAHRKNKASVDHTVIPLGELLVDSPLIDESNLCEMHEQQKIEYYCYDHSKPCCRTCVCRNHRICVDVKSVESVAELLQDNKDIDQLLRDIDSYKNTLQIISTEEENNIVKVDNNVDEITEKLTQLKANLTSHFDKLENEALTKLSKMSKECKSRINTVLDEISKRKQFLEYCHGNLQTLKENNSSVVRVVKYNNIKRNFEEMKHSQVLQTNIDFRAPVKSDIEEILNKSNLLDLSVSCHKYCSRFTFDVTTATMKIFTEFKDRNTHDVAAAILTSDNEIILVEYQGKACKLFNPEGSLLKTLSEFNEYPRDISYGRDEILVSIPGEKKVKRLSIDDFEHSETILMEENCFGIASFDGHIYASTNEGIIKLDEKGKRLGIYPTTGCSFNIAVDFRGNVIYSESNSHIVKCINQEKELLWSYKHQKLSKPYGLSTDCVRNIYVTGRDSSNIHVLSEGGELLRIFENIPRPWAIKFLENTLKFVIITENNHVQVYELENERRKQLTRKTYKDEKCSMKQEENECE
ncbi:transcription intermediary factor 1-alpha-like [Saccostrea echinata]|uniref:transcription intermediary factor 1-alpha-like n=1 Tax=Saccostrea echinata TaxID=191078 RepID=UPI002A809684|nr:transcription intermediary factor 1-alpha-like [Saccostrea echinata]